MHFINESHEALQTSLSCLVDLWELMKGISRGDYFSSSSSDLYACFFFLVIWNYWSQRESKNTSSETSPLFIHTRSGQRLIQVSILLPAVAAMNSYIAKNKNRTSIHNTPSCCQPHSNYFQFRLLPETNVILCIQYSTVDSSSRYLTSNTF